MRATVHAAPVAPIGRSFCRAFFRATVQHAVFSQNGRSFLDKLPAIFAKNAQIPIGRPSNMAFITTLDGPSRLFSHFRPSTPPSARLLDGSPTFCLKSSLCLISNPSLLCRLFLLQQRRKRIVAHAVIAAAVAAASAVTSAIVPAGVTVIAVSACSAVSAAFRSSAS